MELIEGISTFLFYSNLGEKLALLSASCECRISSWLSNFYLGVTFDIIIVVVVTVAFCCTFLLLFFVGITAMHDCIFHWVSYDFRALRDFLCILFIQTINCSYEHVTSCPRPQFSSPSYTECSPHNSPNCTLLFIYIYMEIVRRGWRLNWRFLSITRLILHIAFASTTGDSVSS